MPRPYRLVLVTFADSRMQKSIDRIQKQATDLNFFDEIYAWNQKDLNQDFVKKFKKKLRWSVRGYGYWCWKPQVVLQALEKMNQGDILCYTDVGCHIRPEGLKRLQEYIDLTVHSQSGIVGFQGGYCEKDWAKGDVFDYFEVRDNPDITHTNTIVAGAFFIRKTPQTLALIKNWLKAYEDNFHLADDTPSLSPNLPGFIENRHDQALFSILCKKAKIDTVDFLELDTLKYDERGAGIWTGHEHFPFWAIRDKQFGVWYKFFYIDIHIYRKRFFRFLIRFIPIRSVRKDLRSRYKRI